LPGQHYVARLVVNQQILAEPVFNNKNIYSLFSILKMKNKIPAAFASRRYFMVKQLNI